MKEYFTSVGIYSHEKNSKELAWKYKTKAGAYYREKVINKIILILDEGNC